jgi:hypothetical protein
MTIWRMRIACWIPTAINTHSEDVILIVCPLQQWFTNATQCYVKRTLLYCILLGFIKVTLLRAGYPRNLGSIASKSKRFISSQKSPDRLSDPPIQSVPEALACGQAAGA